MINTCVRLDTRDIVGLLIVYTEGLLNENDLNHRYINHSISQLGHTESRKYGHVVYLGLYEYAGTVHLTNHTQVKFLS